MGFSIFVERAVLQSALKQIGVTYLLSITADSGVGRLSHLSMALDDSEQFVIAIWHFFILIVS